MESASVSLVADISLPPLYDDSDTVVVDLNNLAHAAAKKDVNLLISSGYSSGQARDSLHEDGASQKPIDVKEILEELTRGDSDSMRKKDCTIDELLNTRLRNHSPSENQDGDPSSTEGMEKTLDTSRGSNDTSFKTAIENGSSPDNYETTTQNGDKSINSEEVVGASNIDGDGKDDETLGGAEENETDENEVPLSDENVEKSPEEALGLDEGNADTANKETCEEQFEPQTDSITDNNRTTNVDEVLNEAPCAKGDEVENMDDDADCPSMDKDRAEQDITMATENEGMDRNVAEDNCDPEPDDTISEGQNEKTVADGDLMDTENAEASTGNVLNDDETPMEVDAADGNNSPANENNNEDESANVVSGDENRMSTSNAENMDEDDVAIELPVIDALCDDNSFDKSTDKDEANNDNPYEGISVDEMNETTGIVILDDSFSSETASEFISEIVNDIVDDVIVTTDKDLILYDAIHDMIEMVLKCNDRDFIVSDIVDDMVDEAMREKECDSYRAFLSEINTDLIDSCFIDNRSRLKRYKRSRKADGSHLLFKQLKIVVEDIGKRMGEEATMICDRSSRSMRRAVRTKAERKAFVKKTETKAKRPSNTPSTSTQRRKTGPMSKRTTEIQDDSSSNEENTPKTRTSTPKPKKRNEQRKGKQGEPDRDDSRSARNSKRRHEEVDSDEEAAPSRRSATKRHAKGREDLSSDDSSGPIITKAKGKPVKLTTRSRAGTSRSSATSRCSVALVRMPTTKFISAESQIRYCCFCKPWRTFMSNNGLVAHIKKDHSEDFACRECQEAEVEQMASPRLGNKANQSKASKATAKNNAKSTPQRSKAPATRVSSATRSKPTPPPPPQTKATPQSKKAATPQSKGSSARTLPIPSRMSTRKSIPTEKQAQNMPSTSAQGRRSAPPSRKEINDDSSTSEDDNPKPAARAKPGPLSRTRPGPQSKIAKEINDDSSTSEDDNPKPAARAKPGPLSRTRPGPLSKKTPQTRDDSSSNEDDDAKRASRPKPGPLSKTRPISARVAAGRAAKTWGRAAMKRARENSSSEDLSSPERRASDSTSRARRSGDSGKNVATPGRRDLVGLTCPVCHIKMSSNERAYEAHMNTHKKTQDRTRNANDSKGKSTAKESLECVYCSIVFKTKTDLERHQKIHEDDYEDEPLTIVYEGPKTSQTTKGAAKKEKPGPKSKKRRWI